MIKDYTLPKTGELATIQVLGPEHLSEVLALQAETRAALPDDQKMFVLPQSSSYFEKLLDKKNGLMIGVHVQEKLISQMAVMGTMTLSDVIDQQRLTRNDITFHHAAPTDTVVIAKSMAVHPDFRGNELSQHMLEAALSLPFVNTAGHMFAQISVENTRSWELFLNHGFGIVGAGIDPQDGKPRFILQKPMLDFAFDKQGPVADDVDASSDFSAIMRLTQRDALIGRLEGTEGLNLTFYSNADLNPVWYNFPLYTKSS